MTSIPMQLKTYITVMESLLACTGPRDAPAYTKGVWFDGRAVLCTNSHMLVVVGVSATPMDSQELSFVPATAFRKHVKEMKDSYPSTCTSLIRLVRCESSVKVHMVPPDDVYTPHYTYELAHGTVDPVPVSLARWRDTVRPRASRMEAGCSSVGVDPRYVQKISEVFGALGVNMLMRNGQSDFDPVQFDSAKVSGLPDGITSATAVLACLRVF